MPRLPSSAGFARRLGARVRHLREELNITQEQLAWDCDLDKGYLSQIESGKRLPSLGALAMMAKRLGVEAADVLAFPSAATRLALLDATRRRDREAVHALLRKLGLL